MELKIFNRQPTEKQENREDGSLDIVSIFLTLQGEGPFAGTPAVFIRCAGCNLSSTCILCDTDYTTNRHLLSVQKIVSQVQSLMPKPGLVVLTGGEPLRQNIFPIVIELAAEGYWTQIETNGTLFPIIPDGWGMKPGEHTYGTTIVCSPKTGSINEKLKPYIDHLKYIVEVGKIDAEDGLPLDSLGAGVRVARPWPSFKGRIYVQPLDEGDVEKNKLHTKAAVESCLKYGYTLCLQIHKIVGLD